MILIDRPYISEFLIRTIKENNFQIVATPVAKNMVSDESLNWISEKDARGIFENKSNHPVYTNSENAIGWIEKNFRPLSLPTQIQVFKNKIKFRELLQDVFPNYFFKGIGFEQLESLDMGKMKFPFIVKPAVGFFSIGVHKVGKPAEWGHIVEKIKNEIEGLNGLYPKEVLNAAEFIIEEMIEGEEYAVDCYCDHEGTPVILNILHHVFSSDNDVSDRIYTSSREIIENNETKVQGFLQIMGEKANLKNFPAHVEVRIDNKGEIVPIEVNPLRFGGWCTTGDLSWYAYGINSYECFLKGKKPDWQKIFKNRNDKKYSIVVLDNNSRIKESEIDYFDYEQLLKDFEKPLSLRKVDFDKYSVFGFLFTETTMGNEEELDRILKSDLRKYIKETKTLVDKGQNEQNSSTVLNVPT